MPTEIIDAHHHLWNPVSNSPDIGYQWLKKIGAPKPFGDPTPIQRDYLIDEFLGEPTKAKLIGSVHLQADGAIPDPVAETNFIQNISDKNNFPIAIIGFVDLGRDDAETMIKAHLRSKNFRGVRQILSRLETRPDLSFAAKEYIEDKKWRQNFALLGKYGLSFDLQAYPEQMQKCGDFFADHPDVPIIIDHAGSPWDQSANGLKRLEKGLSNLARLDHIHIKLGGFGMFDVNWNAASIAPIFNMIETLFGRQRMVFASNFPVDKLMRSYEAILVDMLELTTDWSKAERDGFFCRNACRFYRF